MQNYSLKPNFYILSKTKKTKEKKKRLKNEQLTMCGEQTSRCISRFAVMYTYFCSTFKCNSKSVNVKKRNLLHNKERSHRTEQNTKKTGFSMLNLLSSSISSHHIESDRSVLSFGANLVSQEFVIQSNAFNEIIRTESFPSTLKSKDSFDMQSNCHQELSRKSGKSCMEIISLVSQLHVKYVSMYFVYIGRNWCHIMYISTGQGLFARLYHFHSMAMVITL